MTGLTTTVAKPEMDPLFALTVLGNVPPAPPAVKSPLGAMLPPFATTDQTGEIGRMLPPASLPTAANSCVALLFSVSGLGVTVMVARVPIVTVTEAVPEILPLEAFTVLVNAP